MCIDADEKVCGFLLSHMEEEPMTTWRELPADMDVEKLVAN